MSDLNDLAATAAEAPAVRAIRPGDKVHWARLFVAYGVFYKTAFTQEIVDNVFERLIGHSGEIDALVVTDSDDRPIGFAHFRLQYDTFTGGPGWFLDDLYVDPAARGAGAATALIETLSELATASGGGTLRWITAADNAAAQRVYDRVATRTSWVTYEKVLATDPLDDQPSTHDHHHDHNSQGHN
ncbi:GNAT family N-acetyltransferase [Glaciihabitans arcticus]|uniref:GNAT family N-acetyltransferase n=1 Tax=Glaciihabitans arcticus TaxID=2668039 RepID=A0A4Q9GQC4_9MICO|nr:GNAT family N-acetyltransferase [Glaciihabitans arcticus]TBN57066.1 GNAT family N-acetyltransferase [Glaciihabitans arcticus]